MKAKTKISMALFVALLICTVNVSAAWWDNSWDYKRPIEINSSSVLTDYQVAINVTYDSDMQPDFDDIRFTNEGEAVSLDYWIESKVDSSWVYVWVEVDPIDTNNGTQAYMYYGNSTINSGSDIANTFIFGDDFSGTLTDKWNIFGTALNSGGICTITGGTAWDADGISSKTTFDRTSNSYIARSRFKNNEVTRSDIMFGYSNQASLSIASGFHLYHAIGSTYVRQSGNVHDFGYINAWGIYGIHEIHMKQLNDYGIITETTAGYTGTSTENNKAITYNKYDDTIDIDWIIVRKYTFPEPTYSIGDEETSNQPPNDPNPSITPATVYTNTDIVCTAKYIDIDGDNGTLNFTISVDGTSQNTCDYSVGNNTQETCGLSSGNYNKTHVINCTVTATDNNSQTSTSSITKTVQNSPPTKPTSLTPTSGTYTTSVTINCSGSTDNDSSDTVYYDIETNIIGKWTTLIGKWTTLDDNGDGNYLWGTSSYTQDNVGLRCRATDLMNNSDYGSTGTINIDNTAPPINLNTSSDYNTILDIFWAYIEFYSDSTLNACLVDWNGTNETADVSGTTCYFNKTDSIGNYTFRGWANDSVGNWNYTDEYWIYINATTTTTTTSTTIPSGGGGGWGGGTPNVAKVIKVPTCDDGIQNQGEEGVDCGGPCPPCEAPTTATIKATTTTTLTAATTTIKKATTTTTTTTRATTTTIRATTTTIPTDGGIALATTGILIFAFVLFAGIIVYLMRMK